MWITCRLCAFLLGLEVESGRGVIAREPAEEEDEEEDEEDEEDEVLLGLWVIRRINGGR